MDRRGSGVRGAEGEFLPINTAARRAPATVTVLCFSSTQPKPLAAEQNFFLFFLIFFFIHSNSFSVLFFLIKHIHSLQCRMIGERTNQNFIQATGSIQLLKFYGGSEIIFLLSNYIYNVVEFF